MIVLVIFFLTPARFRWGVLLAASYYFYGTFKLFYPAVIAVSTLLAYITAIAMEREQQQPKKKIYLLFGLVANIGILFTFKYFDFLDSSLQQVLGTAGISFESHALKLLIPVGISFYTFQIISYLADVYRGDTRAEKHPGIFALYISFFPKLLAGPIERAGLLIPQLHKDTHFDAWRFTSGLKLICWGLFKKMVVADRLAVFVNIVFSDPQGHTGLSLVFAIFLYSFQIYCDFSGYTDIAIGLARLFGIDLSDNFNRPYTATSIADFWRRWHISLSSWLRDYLYIPLGGSRVRVPRHYLNYLIVFLICGLWHGANWTFVVWGLIHGLYLVFGRVTGSLRAKATAAAGLDKAPVLHRRIRIFLTFILVSVAWVFFRANTFSDAIYIITHLHTGWGNILNSEFLDAAMFLGRPKIDMFIAVASLVFFGLVHHIEPHEKMRDMFSGKPIAFRFVFYYIITVSVLVLSLPGLADFIYFQF